MNPHVRELTSHRVNGLNEALRIFVLDQPGSGGACHEYLICVPYPKPKLGMFAPQWQAVADHLQSQPNLESFTTPNNECFVLNESMTMAYNQDAANSDHMLFSLQRIAFQNGPVKEADYNGSSHEALLAILIDRLEGFQKGQYANHDNQMALDHCQGARLWLHKRTMDRVSRGVEGTHQK